MSAADSSSPSTSATSPAVKALESLRQRLAALNSNLVTLRMDVERGDPLPPYSAFDRILQLTSSSFAELAKVMSSNQQVLSRMHAYPLPNFPFPEQENMRGIIMKKKLEPNAEELVDRGYRIAREFAEKGGSQGMDLQQLQETIEWAAGRALSALESQPWEANYTNAELDTLEAGGEVRTGIKQKLIKRRANTVPDDDDSDESDDEDEESDTGEQMDVDKEDRKPPALSLDQMLRFLSGRDGRLPGS